MMRITGSGTDAAILWGDDLATDSVSAAAHTNSNNYHNITGDTNSTNDNDNLCGDTQNIDMNNNYNNSDAAYNDDLHRTNSTLLFSAIEAGDIPMIKRLLASNASPNWPNSMQGGKTSVHCAAGKGNVVILSTLIEAGATVNCRRFDGIFPLHLAVLHNHGQAVTYLIQQGAIVDCLDANGGTPLHFSCIKGDVNIVRFLLKFGANVNLRDSTGLWPPLHYAVYNGKSEVVNYLTSLNNIDLTLVDKYGQTCLHLAASRGLTSIAESLIKAGCDLEVKDKYGHTPLDLAKSSMKNKEIVELIEKHLKLHWLAKQQNTIELEKKEEEKRAVLVAAGNRSKPAMW